MTTQPLRVPNSHFAKTSWLILPLIAYAMLCWLSTHDRYVGVLIGPLTDAPSHNSDGAAIMPVCEYLRLGAKSIALLEISGDAENCGVLRIVSENEGRLLTFGRITNLWKAIK